jgi:hypothetical protein
MSNWNLEGLHVTGLYMGIFPVSGRVELSRVKYGGGVQHTVVLDQQVEIYDTKRDRLLLDNENISSVRSAA